MARRAAGVLVGSVALLASLGALAADPAGPEEALSHRGYRFCHVPGADADAAQAWCELLDEAPPEACPGLRATCDGEARDEFDPRQFWKDLRSGCAQGDGGRRQLAPEPEEPEEPMSCDSEEPEGCEGCQSEGCDPDSPAAALGTLLRWVAAVVIAVLLMVLVRVLLGFVSRDEAAVRLEPVGDQVVEVPAPDEVPDLPGADLLGAARKALAEGRPGDAILLGRAAALRSLAEGGRIRLHRARTDREYVRSLREHADIQRLLRQVVRAVERHRWGGKAPDQGRAQAVLDAVQRIVGLLVALALVALLPLGEARADDRYGPWGDAGLRTVLVEHGLDVSWRLRALDPIGEDVDVLILDADGVLLEDADWPPLRAWVEAGGLLVVAGSPERIDLPELGVPALLGGQIRLDEELESWGLPLPVWPGGPDGAWEGAGGRVWVGLPEHDIAVVEHLALGQGAVLAIADSRLLVNGALVAPDNAAFLGRMLYVGHDAGAWVLPWDARVQLATRVAVNSESPLSSLASANLLPLVVQLLVLLTLVALWKGWPFGPLRDPPGGGRLSFGEHVTAIGHRWFRMGASRHAASVYARLWLDRLGPEGLQLVAMRAGYDRERAHEWVVYLTEVASQPEGPNRSTDMETVEELWRITRSR